MQKFDIVCDCDGVLLDFSKGFAKWNNRNYSDFEVDEDPLTYDFGLGGDELDELWKRVQKFWQSSEMACLDHMEPEIVQNFKKLRSIHNVQVASAVDPSTMKDRLENLKEFEITESELILDVDKIDKIINVIKPHICIDDSPENIKKLCSAGITVFYPNYVKYTNTIDEDIAIPYQNWDHLILLIEILSEMCDRSTE